MTKEKYAEEISDVLDASDRDRIAIDVLSKLLEERDDLIEEFEENKKFVVEGYKNPYVELQLKLDSQILSYLKALGLYRYATTNVVTDSGGSDSVTSDSPKNNLLKMFG